MLSLLSLLGKASRGVVTSECCNNAVLAQVASMWSEGRKYVAFVKEFQPLEAATGQQ